MKAHWKGGGEWGERSAERAIKNQGER